jgi:hypothetical protein
MPTQGHTLAPGSDSLRSFRAGTCVLLTTVFRALDGPNAIGLPSTIALRGVNLYHVGCYSEAIKERRLPVGREDSKCSGLCRRRARDCSRAERTCNRCGNTGATKYTISTNGINQGWGGYNGGATPGIARAGRWNFTGPRTL